MNTTTEETSLRDELASSFDAAPDTSIDAPAPAVSTSEESYSAPTDSPDELPVGETAEQKAQREYNRDQKGKFAPGQPEAKVVPAVDPKKAAEGVVAAPKAGQPPVAKDPLERAPQSWKPEEREAWAAIPAPARAAIYRIEQQVQGALRETAQQRQFADAVQKAVDPYRGTIEAEGSNVVAAISSLMQTAQALRTAPPAHKAQLVAGMVKQFGIDINQLDMALSGAAAPRENPEVAAMRQQFEREIAPVRQWQEQQMRQQQFNEQQEAGRVVSNIQNFSTDKEFINDVRVLMADIIDIRHRNGMECTLEEAYNAACQAHPDVSRVLNQRAQVTAAQNINSNAQKARQAAVSIGGSPALGGSNESPSDSIRDSIVFAMNQTSR